jgi:hypothetical protein
MHKIYETMQAKGEIGPFEMRNGQLQPREFFDYPKMIYLDGPGSAPSRTKVVKNLAEEVEVLGGRVAEPAKVDPLEIERQKLREATEAMHEKERGLDEEIAKMKAQLAEFQAQMAANSPKPKPPVEDKVEPKGSSFRPAGKAA